MHFWIDWWFQAWCSRLNWSYDPKEPQPNTIPWNTNQKPQIFAIWIQGKSSLQTILSCLNFHWPPSNEKQCCTPHPTSTISSSPLVELTEVLKLIVAKIRGGGSEARWQNRYIHFAETVRNLNILWKFHFQPAWTHQPSLNNNMLQAICSCFKYSNKCRPREAKRNGSIRCWVCHL